MFRTILVSFLFAHSFTLWAQHYPDSLRLALKHAGSDNERIEILNEQAYLLQWTSSEKALSYATEAKRLSEKTGNKLGEIKSLVNLSAVMSMTGNSMGAINYIQKAKRIAEEMGDSNQIARCYNMLGNINTELHNYKEAILFYKHAKKINLKIKNIKGLAANLSNLGSSYFENKEIDSALFYAQEAYRVSQSVKDWKVDMIGGIFVTLGRIQYRMKNDEIAIAYFRKAIESGQKFEDYIDICDAAQGNGMVYARQNKKDSSRVYFEMALQAARKANYTSGMMKSYKSLKNFYQPTNKDSTLKYITLESALKDSLFTSEKLRHLEAMNYQEKNYEEQKAEEKKIAEQERKENIQFAILALLILGVLILFLVLSHSIAAGPKLIRFLGIINLLIVFEFLNLLLHPFWVKITGHSPFLMLLIMVMTASVLIPLHHKLEHWVTHRLVEKNNKIRFEAAKKTIETLGKESEVG